MKVKVKKSGILSLIGKTQNIVERRNTMPVLINVLLEAQNDRLKVFATNLEVSLTDEIEVSVLTPGKVAVSAKSLFEIVKELNDTEDVILTKKENNWLKITQGKSVFNLVGIGSEEYPVFPTHTPKDFIEIEANVLADMIGKTIYSVSNDETRYHLNGVYFEKRNTPSGPGLLMVATDGHRLSLVDKSGKSNDLSMTEGVIIPRKGLTEIYKLLENVNGLFKMAVEGPQLVVAYQNTILMIRLIEGKYPNYRQLIPQNLNEHVQVRRDDLLACLRRVSLLSNQKSKGVTLHFSKGKLEITSNNPELGDAKEEIDVDYKGDGLRIGFNAKYIMDVLASIDEDEISLDLKDQLSPGVMRPKENKDYTCVIMPMRI